MIKKSIIGAVVFLGVVFFTQSSEAKLLYSGEGPRIYGRLHEVGAHSARIRWSTGDPSITWMKYGETIYLDTEVKEEGVVKKNHEVLLRGLRADTTYYYMIRARNNLTSKESWFESRSFKTLAEGKSEINENTPVLPTISFEDQIQKGITSYYMSKQETKSFDVNVPLVKVLEVRSMKQGSAAEVKWITDTPSASSIEYGATWDYGFEAASVCTTKCTTHSAILDGLTRDKKIFLRIYATSAESLDETNSGLSESRTAHLSFIQSPHDGIVEVIPRDFTSPQLRSVSIVVKESTASGVIPIDIHVSTDEPARVSVELSPEHDQSITMQSSELRRQSTIQFSSLSPGVYHYQVLARDEEINKTTSRYFTFIIPGQQTSTQNVRPSLHNAVSAPLILEKKSSKKISIKKKSKKPVIKKKSSKKKIAIKKVKAQKSKNKKKK